MLRKISFLILGLVSALTSKAQTENELKIMVVSDVHIMAPELLKAEGKAIDNYIANDRKLLREGPEMAEEMVEAVLKEKPEVLLISGDLTKDGELVSHLMLRDNYLKPIREAGIKICVVPGNHDINNPDALYFDGDKTLPAQSIQAEDFAEIYADYGYGDAIARDLYSLSYVAQISPDTRVLCLDANRYEENDAEGHPVVGGRLKKETIKFIRQQTRKAKKEGVRMIALQHHGMVLHWKYQNLIMGDYLVKGYKRIARILARNDVKLIFTGHFHANDISTRKIWGKSISDVETGSIVSYPAPYRMVRLTEDKAYINTEYLSGKYIDFPEGKSLEAELKYYAMEVIPSVVRTMIPESISPKVVDDCCNVLGNAYIAHLGGDEKCTSQELTALNLSAKALRKESLLWGIVLKQIGNSFYKDRAPEDLNTVISLK